MMPARSGEHHRISKICEILDKYEPIVLSKASSRDSFRCLVATIISAQTTGTQTRKAATALFEVAATPEAMVRLGQENIASIIKTVGLWRNKAKSIYTTSLCLLTQFDGRVPADIKQLQTLPGVGLKTASIVMAFCVRHTCHACRHSHISVGSQMGPVTSEQRRCCL